MGIVNRVLFPYQQAYSHLLTYCETYTQVVWAGMGVVMGPGTEFPGPRPGYKIFLRPAVPSHPAPLDLGVRGSKIEKKCGNPPPFSERLKPARHGGNARTGLAVPRNSPEGPEGRSRPAGPGRSREPRCPDGWAAESRLCVPGQPAELARDGRNDRWRAEETR